MARHQSFAGGRQRSQFACRPRVSATSIESLTQPANGTTFGRRRQPGAIHRTQWPTVLSARRLSTPCFGGSLELGRQGLSAMFPSCRHSPLAAANARRRAARCHGAPSAPSPAVHAAVPRRLDATTRRWPCLQPPAANAANRRGTAGNPTVRERARLAERRAIRRGQAGTRGAAASFAVVPPSDSHAEPTQVERVCVTPPWCPSSRSLATLRAPVLPPCAAATPCPNFRHGRQQAPRPSPRI